MNVIFSVCIGAMSEQTDAKLDLLQYCGIRAVEIPGRVLEQDGREDKDAYRKSLQIASEKLPAIGVEAVSVHLPYWPADISSLDPDERKIGLGTIARALAGYGEYFPGGIAVVHPGDVVADPESMPERMAHSIDSLCKVAQMASMMNVRLAIENMRPGAGPHAGKALVGQKIDLLLSAVEKIASDDVGLCLDTSHANLSGDVCSMARQCGGKLMHLHISDNLGDRDLHLPIGDGSVPWGELGDVLFGIGYNGLAVLEVGPQPDRDFEEIIESSRDELVDWVW